MENRQIHHMWYSLEVHKVWIYTCILQVHYVVCAFMFIEWDPVYGTAYVFNSTTRDFVFQADPMGWNLQIHHAWYNLQVYKVGIDTSILQVHRAVYAFDVHQIRFCVSRWSYWIFQNLHMWYSLQVPMDGVYMYVYTCYFQVQCVVHDFKFIRFVFKPSSSNGILCFKLIPSDECLQIHHVWYHL